MSYTENKSAHSNVRPSNYNSLKTDNQAVILGMSAPDVKFFELEPAEVLDVILNDQHPSFSTYEDIGKIQVRLLYSQKNYGYGDNSAKLNWAKPGDANVKSYPLKHEIVIVANYITREGVIDSAGPDLTPKGLYYFDRLNLLNSVNHNAMQDISLTKKFKDTPSSGYTQPEDLVLGNEIKPNDEIHPLESKEGDIIYEGRFGNSIRFGNNPETGEPEVLIRNGQKPNISTVKLAPIVEDINKDFSSIWFTSDRNIPLTIACNNQKSFSAPSEFSGKQIIINSDRIILNAKYNELLGYSNTNINFSAKGTFNINSDQETIINSKAIYLGLDAEEKLVKGDTLLDLLKQLVDEITKIKVMTGTGPSSPPINTPQFVAIKSKLSSFLSKQNYTL